jgi:small subunit ribosomal protein S4
MRKLKKTYKRPRKMWDKARIERDKKLKKDFGLVREREIWRAETMLRKYRRLARQLVATRDKEEEKELLSNLAKMGILERGAVLDDVLGLTVELILERRLQTIVFRRGLANTAKQARQMIVHGHVKLKGRVYKYPSRIVLKTEEDQIEIIKPKAS